MTKPKLPEDTKARCGWGNCTNWLAPDGSIEGGSGPMLCPCDHTPGWKSKWPAGQGKPSFEWRVRGRNGSRVQRSRHRKAHRIVTMYDADSNTSVQVWKQGREIFGA